MKMNWKHTAVSVLITTSLLSSSYAAMAAEVAGANSGTPAAVTYKLTDSLNVDIKTVLNDRIEAGTRVGVVVRMKNNGAAISRVPEYELRVKTVEGVEYTLQASASNPRSIQPKATTELSYLADIDRTDTVTLAEANWTEVDYYVYPKTEVRIVAIPISGQSWKGSDMKITDPASVKKWGETFKIPSLTSPLEYTPISIQKEVTEKGTVQVLQLLVTNPTDRRETLPEFIIDGKTASKIYEGKQVTDKTTEKAVQASVMPESAITGTPLPETDPATTAPAIDPATATGGATGTGEQQGTNTGLPASTGADTASVGSSNTAGSQSQSYYGNKVEQGEIILESNEQKYIHFAISTDNDTVLSSINLLTPEKFTQAGASGVPTVVSYNVGRLNILLPSTAAKVTYPSYVFGLPMVFDPLSQLIHSNLEVSVVEFHINDNTDEGSKSVTSKFKIFNKSDIPMTVPVFQTELLSLDGYTYSGNRQTLTTQNILPNSALVVSYSYTLPNSEKGSGLVLKVNDTTKVAPYKMNLASYNIEIQAMETEEKFSVYPFDGKVTYWTLTPVYNRTGNNTYSYKARFNLDLTRQEQIQIDTSFSQLQFELYDSLDRLIGTHKANFIGAGRLVSGENNFAFESTTEQLDRPLTIRMFEVFTTPAGDAKRLLGVYKQ
ncbi:hypothetical protein [Paenibacillus agricola]|uniref:Uncharacterized protein n=1 Tax=Paenibacillus agricola TaxID=2716264 RepID=A0ABX0IXA1_9BACL|nr:hypothetical protein [Paenibacillus agricola]NHN28567.1 hypothetical protein [Paenibacillus agricola]